MPRSSLADRLDRASLSRVSAGKGSLGRYSIGTDVSGSGSVSTRHWVNSVSDIYGPDEIEELLEDRNRLELAAFETEDIQDFDIDGSQLGQDPSQRFYGHRRRSGRSSRRRNPHYLSQQQQYHQQQQHGHAHPSHHAHNPAASPTFSVRSWDSHARYQSPYEDEYEGVEVGPLPSAPHLHPGAHHHHLLHHHHPHPRLRGDPHLPPGGDEEGCFDGGGYDGGGGDDEDGGGGVGSGGLEGGGGGGIGDDDAADGGIFLPSRPRKSILCYCDTSTLRNPKTILRVLLVVSCLDALPQLTLN